jgi:hypothetical protein
MDIRPMVAASGSFPGSPLVIANVPSQLGEVWLVIARHLDILVRKTAG